MIAPPPLLSFLMVAGVSLLSLAARHAGAAELPKWTHLSSKTGELPAPNVGRQCSSLIFDVDRDGTNDFLIGGWGENGERKIEWFRRRAGGWDKYLIDADVKFPEAGGDFADIDGENPGRGSFTERVLDQGKESHLGTQFADIDGGLDLVSIAWDNHKFLHVWRNDAPQYKHTG